MAELVPIRDLSSPELDVYARLPEVQLYRYHEPAPGLFIAESPNVITRALDAGYTPVSMLVSETETEGAAAAVIARAGDIPVYTAPFDVLTKLTGFRLTRGILCAMRRKRLPSAGELLTAGSAAAGDPSGAEAAKAGFRRIAVLENVMNPTNVGAIFRSAAALGMDAVLLTPGCADPLYRRAARVSMGTVFQVPWTFFDGRTEAWPSAGLALLKESGFRTAAMALSDDSVGIADPALKAAPRLAVVLGTEGDGLARETIAACDYTVKIPMAHGVDSLNVAAASAVAFWELGKG